MLYIIISLAVLIIGVVLYKVILKMIFVKNAQKLYDIVEKKLGTFIEKWDENKFLEYAEDLSDIVKKRKYKFDEAVKLVSYYHKLPETIYKNNLTVLEKLIADYLTEFTTKVGNGQRYIISKDIKPYAEQFKKETKDFADKSICYDSTTIRTFKNIYQKPEQYLIELNKKYMENEKQVCKSMLDNINGKSLDENQRNAVVNDDLCQLVVAGAGSGKTLTISAKVKYLVERKKINPKDILLISFTRKAAEEMKQRIGKLGIDVDSVTFHKYGLKILSNVNGKIPDIADDIDKYIDKYLDIIVYSDNELAKKFLVLLGTLMLPVFDGYEKLGDIIEVEQRQDLTTLKGMYESYRNKEKYEKIQEKIEQCKSKLKPLHDKLEEMKKKDKENEVSDRLFLEEQALQYNPLDKYEEINIDIEKLEVEIGRLMLQQRSIKNEKLKSAEEVMLANIFFLDGVEYEYEREYPNDEEDNLRKHYRPDFYLKESDVYWEHFGIDEENRAHQYTEPEEEKYLEGINWKREIHAKNETRLAETYSWQFRKNQILDAINENYQKFGIKRHKVNFCDVIKEILKGDENGNIDSFKTLLSTFISLFKSYGYGTEKFEELKKDVNSYKKDKKISENALERRKKRDLLFLDFAESFYTFYSEALIQERKIDFNDMIIQAAGMISEGIFIPNYKYVIIDEYQDISVGRYKLIKETLRKTEAKLFCVGDDWQSIYRFSGSEVSLFTNFEKHFGLYSRTDIVQTYRNSQELLDISGAFVQANPEQMKKLLKSDKHIEHPIRIVRYGDKSVSPVLTNEQFEDTFSDGETTLEGVIQEIVTEFPDGDILILGRNNGDLKSLLESKKTKKNILIKQNNGDTTIVVNNYPKLKIRFMTVHKAKGLEADNVIVLNMKNSKSGFPNQIIDDPVLNLLRMQSETFEFAEERRLFYVALTRTKNRTYLFAPLTQGSRFLDDIRNLKENCGRSAIETIHIEETKDSTDLVEDSEETKLLRCPVCKVGTLIKKKNAKGQSFVSCSNYPVCNYTVSSVEVVRKNKRCPVCGNFLKKRRGKYGEFLGCMSYPYCRYTENIVTEITKPRILSDKEHLMRTDAYFNAYSQNGYNFNTD